MKIYTCFQQACVIHCLTS